jgi:hypothetical protein
MGAYNEVRAALKCPSCGRLVEVDAQFKYGSVVHHSYAIGERLVWGANDIGRPGSRLVVADGEAGPCPMCSYDGDWPVYVFVKDDIVERVDVASGAHDFAAANATFLILDES